MSDSNVLNSIGKWPISGPEARKAKRILVIKPSQTLDVIHGANSHMLVSFAVSNDFIHFGSMTIAGGVITDSERHAGDEVFYVLEGVISVVIAEPSETHSVSKSRFEANTGDRFLIPEGTWHQYLNTSQRPAKLIFGVAPEL
jgi:mannose-6-phosphate isomerase-like protein (cupin superfamily)